MTHLADADGADSASTERQLGTFRAILEQIRQCGLTLPLIHTANSAAIVRFPEAHFSLVRPGIMLYGYHTLPTTIPASDLRPVLSLQTRIVQRHAWTKIHELHQSYAGLGPQLLKISLFEGLNENGRVPPVPLVLGE